MQEFLARFQIRVQTTHDARKEPLTPQQALQRLLGRAEEIYVCKGRQVLTVSLKKDKVPAEELHRLLAGPTGNLRAPTALIGKKVLVGFDEATCRQLFGV